MLEPPGLYVHVPFCSAICPYCDFAVTTGGAEKRRSFVDALEAEIELVGESWEAVETLYLGGGTPSALEVGGLERLLSRLRRRFDPAAGARLFLEANPEDVTADALAAWRDLGVATLSLGVQSFDGETLATLGRRHGPAQAQSAVEAAMKAGFDTVSIDLIYGVPGRSAADWSADLALAVALAPDHVSCYQLTFHRQTPFGRWKESGRMVEPAEDDRAELFLLTHERLAAAGYDGYEVSNFARRPEHRSRHNAKYWQRAAYLGLGPSAHSFDGARRRWWNERDLATWQRRVVAGERPVGGEEELSDEEVVLEQVMLGLRTRAGVDFGRLDQETSRPLLATNLGRLEDWRRRGLVKLDGNRALPTLRGLAVADRLAAEVEI